MRRNHLLLLLLSALLVTPTIACSALEDVEPASQEAEHREGDPTYGQYGWLWANESIEEFKQIGGSIPPEYVELDHPMTQRLQFWVEAMDAALRKAHPAALRNTPTPQVIIRKERDPNAWVTSLPVAWDVPARIEGDTGAGATPAPREESYFMLDNRGNVSPPDRAPFTRTFDRQNLSELAKFMNDGYAACVVSIQDDALWLGAGCTPRHLGNTKRAKRFAYLATAKHITFTTGYLVELRDEERIVATLAHEMGHYYRSHGNMPSDVTNYFYSLEGGNRADKPALDPRFLDQTQKARGKIRNARGWGPSFEEENKLMAENNLGFYTYEQEADELALELMAKVGIPPGAAIDKMLAVQKADERRGWVDDTGDVKWADCAQLRDRGFKDEAGKWVTVPVGDLDDPHHSWCFRAFNVQREIEAHDYKLGERPTPPGESFSTLLTRL